MSYEEIVSRYAKQILKKFNHDENDEAAFMMVQILLIMAIKEVLNESLSEHVHLTPEYFGD